MSAETIFYDKRAKLYEFECDKTVDQDFLLSLVTPDVKSILEIPCGVGRNTFKLAESGRKVFAVDLEPAMIKRLEERKRGTQHGENITAVVGDIRTLKLDEPFDLIIVSQEAFQLLTTRKDQLEALRALSNNLKEDAVLLIDIATFCKGKAKDQPLQPGYFDPNLKDDKFVKDWTKTLPSSEQFTRYHSQNSNGECYLINYRYVLKDLAGREEQRFSQVKLRRFMFDEFVNLVSCAGLILTDIFGSYDREPFDNQSVRMISLLKK